MPESKRRKVSEEEKEFFNASNLLQSGTHPYGVEPTGNALVKDAAKSCREAGLGVLASLTDELILNILEFLDVQSLGRIANVSRAFYVIGHTDELWKSRVVDSHPSHKAGGFWFQNTWKDTCACLLHPDKKIPPHKPIKVAGYYSDDLFAPWLYASLWTNPNWIAKDNVKREANLSVEDFRLKYEVPGIPVVISDIVRNWPAFKKWNVDYLAEVSGDRTFEAGPVSMTMKQYWEYARKTTEENPLYLFDKRFAVNMPQLAEDYPQPPYFEDLLSVMGSKRPDHRWMIVGAPRSGSSFHVDPNGTSAWNAVMTGAKKWVMFPPNCPPPGVIPSDDGSEVTHPVSLAEWFVNYYPRLQELDLAPIEFVARAGDLVFVPSGWWHCVLNVDEKGNGEPIIAITHNFASRANLKHVRRFLYSHTDQISGCVDPDNLPAEFDKKLVETYPELQNEVARNPLEKGLWHSVATAREMETEDKENEQRGSFSFGF
eukprot:m.108685 g.108685  ORF g.108685 m.108685 type:complete len:486 (+) comp13974_c0_seq1:164-1621(+)